MTETIPIQHRIRTNTFYSKHAVSIKGGTLTPYTTSTYSAIVHISRHLRKECNFKISLKDIFQLRRALKDGFAGKLVLGTLKRQIVLHLKVKVLTDRKYHD